MTAQPVLIDGSWRTASGAETFHAENPATRQPLPDVYPVSSWEDCSAALDAAARAHETLQAAPPAQLAEFLESYANRIERHQSALVEAAHAETALPPSPH